MLLKDFREPLLSFEFIYFRNSFCYGIDNSWSSRYKILGHVGPLGRNLNFFVSLGNAEILRFFEFSVYTEVVLFKTFPQHFELCLYCKYSRSYEEYLASYNHQFCAFFERMRKLLKESEMHVLCNKY